PNGLTAQARPSTRFAPSPPHATFLKYTTAESRRLIQRWRRPTNVWREVTSPAREFRRLTRDRQRGAIPLPAANWAYPLRGQRCRSFTALLGGASRAEAERELAPSRPVLFPLPRRQSRGVPGTKHHRRTPKHHRRTPPPRADTRP